MIKPNSNINQTFNLKPQLPRVTNEKPKKKSADETKRPAQNNAAIQQHKNLARSKREALVKILTTTLAKITNAL